MAQATSNPKAVLAEGRASIGQKSQHVPQLAITGYQQPLVVPAVRCGVNTVEPPH
jgi:hypothetical protein